MKTAARGGTARGRDDSCRNPQSAEKEHSIMIWNEHFDSSDAALGMPGATPAEDLRTVAGTCSLNRLVDARRAAEDGRLVRHVYDSGDGSGCILYFLTGVRSKSQLLAFDFESDEVGFAARRLVRFFDYDKIGTAAIARVLGEEILSRLLKKRKPKRRGLATTPIAKQESPRKTRSLKLETYV